MQDTIYKKYASAEFSVMVKLWNRIIEWLGATYNLRTSLAKQPTANRTLELTLASQSQQLRGACYMRFPRLYRLLTVAHQILRDSQYQHLQSERIYLILRKNSA